MHLLLIRTARLLACCVLITSTAEAQWGPLGAPVCVDSSVAYGPSVIQDGHGGILLAWSDLRNDVSFQTDVYAQRLTSSGEISAGWPDSGLPVAVQVSFQEEPCVADDRQGGALVAWLDHRNASADIYAQRIRGDGTLAPGWPANGVQVAQSGDHDRRPVVVSDGVGGAFVVWDRTPYAGGQTDLYLQHLTASGEIAPGWPEEGLSVCTAPEFQVNQKLIPDGSGGVVIIWDDCRDGACEGQGEVSDIYALRILADGSIAPGWAANGVLVVAGRSKLAVAPDAAGGFYAAGSTLTSFAFDIEYYVQRFTFDGTRSPGWPEGGVRACGAVPDREGLKVCPDGLGGLLLSWYDYRPSPLGSSEIYATRVLANGEIAPGWPADGKLVSDEYGPELYETYQSIAPDGFGGAYVAWEQTYNGRQPVYIQHLSPSGEVAPAWPAHGFPVAQSLQQFAPVVVEDGSHGAIVVWDEANEAEGRLGLFANRFALDGPVAAQLSLATGEATSERVLLVWHGPGADALVARVERRSEGNPWMTVGTAQADGPDRLRYEDRSVQPGVRYGYRLVYADADGEQMTADAWIEVPEKAALALEGMRPNPASRSAAIVFSLPDALTATLVVHDVSGRRVFHREVGSLGAGTHLVPFDGPATLPAGMYWIRLVRQDRALTTRAIIVR